MKFSVIIPAYNEEKLLPVCLKSIFAANLPEDCEIIVVNNASTDRTEDVARNFSGAEVVNEYRKGTNQARQAGFQASKGDILIYFDADTVIPKEWFRIVQGVFEKDPELIAVTGPYQYGETPKVAKIIVWFYDRLIGGLEWIWQKIFRQGGVMIVGGDFAVKREALEKIGGFDTSIKFYGDDTDLTRRLAEIGKIKFIKELSVYSSPRRFEKEGAIKTSLKYIINFFSEWILKRPAHKEHRDIR